MKPIAENVVIQIEITNACNLSCANCSRLVGHHKKPFFMTPSEVEKAIVSLDGFQGRIGMMGGEPTLHPQFLEICEIYQRLIPDRRRRELWTDGFKWQEYHTEIHETFDEDLIHYNDHSRPEEGWHQPILVSIDEVVDDKEKMWKLIKYCWVQRRWSASITPKGAYFCEIAAAIDHALDGPGGWKVEPDWWKKQTDDYESQKQFSCLKCSAALPMQTIPNNHNNFDYCSKGNQQLLSKNGSPKVKQDRTRVLSQAEATAYLDSADEVVPGERGYLESHPEWRPSEFRTKVWHGPGEGDLTAKEVIKLQRRGDKDYEAKDGNLIADIRTSEMYFSPKALDHIKSEMRTEVSQAITDHIGDKVFVEEASILSLLTEVVPGGLSTREQDLLIKYAVDLTLR